MLLASAILICIVIIIGLLSLFDVISEDYGIQCIVIKLICGVAAVTLSICGGQLIIGIALGIAVVLGIVANFLSMAEINVVPGIMNLFVVAAKVICAVLLFVTFFKSIL